MMRTKLLLLLTLLPVVGWSQLTRPFGTGGSGGGGTVTAVTATSPLASSGGTAPDISHNNVGTAGTYTKVTFDAKGHETSGTTADLSGSDVTGTLAAARVGTFTGDITTPGASYVTTLKSTGSAGTYSLATFDAQGRETSGSLGLDTIYSKYGWYALTAGDSALTWEVREGNVTIREIRAIRVGGTSASINVTKNGSSDLLTANYATSTSMASAGTLQNNTMAVGDLVRTTVRAVVGTVTEIYIQILATKPKR